MGNSGWSRNIRVIYKTIVDRKSKGNRGRIMGYKEKSIENHREIRARYRDIG
jgi:hypothetical protein